MEYKFEVQMKIQKPVHEVFEAVYDPKKLSGYFTTGGSSGPLKEGTTVIWKFGDFPGDIPVKVKTVVPDKFISFAWAAAEVDHDAKEAKDAGYETLVEMSFESLSSNNTMVKISEGVWKQSPAGLKGSYGNCQGWTQMMCCLKAYLEYGVNLRKGAYE